MRECTPADTAVTPPDTTYKRACECECEYECECECECACECECECECVSDTALSQENTTVASRKEVNTLF